jgi:isopenicillin-N N-acyltransferase-like protein
MEIKLVSLSGTPEEIGYQHGELLAEQIRNNIDFYRSLFLNYLGSETRVLSIAEKFKKSIQSYNPNFVTEINHIALGAGLAEPLWLYAINARTELSMMESIQECTAIVCPGINLLAQTWDWAKKLEGNFVIMKITFPNGHQILQLTEAGIIGKIGLNNQGLGVTLNFLYDEHIDFSTVPIHILLRQVLECISLDDAKDAAKSSRVGKASNLIIAQAGKAVNIEFAGDRMKYFEIEESCYAHTNHFLHAKPPNIVNEDSYQNSVTRHKTTTAQLKISPEQTTNKLIKILSDQTNGGDAILASYKPDPMEMLGEYGTLATIIMDLENQSLFARNGNPKNKFFSLNSFVEYSCK